MYEIHQLINATKGFILDVAIGFFKIRLREATINTN